MKAALFLLSAALAAADVPALRAPADLLPKTAEGVLTLPGGADSKHGSITVESRGPGSEITLLNNQVKL